MSFNARAYEGAILGFAAGHKLDLVEVPTGQTIFPMYAANGSLACKYIFYFRKPGEQLPRNGEALGTEAEHHPSVWPVEILMDYTLEEAIEHIAQRVSTEEFEAEREVTLGVQQSHPGGKI